MAQKKTQGQRGYEPGRGSNKKSKGRSVLFAPVAFILICLSLIMAMSIFFRVNEIQVEGNTIYTDEEIIEASGIDTGDNLFFINRSSATSRIFARLPYIQEVTAIDRNLPDTVVITVTESNSIAYVASGSGLWLIDGHCKLMGTVSMEESTGFIQVTGVEPIEPAIGDVMELGVEENAKVSYLAEILTEIEVRGLKDKVANIDITSVANPSFEYDGRFLVKLGSKEDTQQKFGILLSAVEQLAAGDTGTIDLSIDNKAHFKQS